MCNISGVYEGNVLREKVIVIGLGEVGLPLYEIIKESGEYEVFGFDMDKTKMGMTHQGTLPNKFDIVHICFPCVEMRKFCRHVSNYVKKYRPYLLIVNSTIPPQTTEWIMAFLRSKKCACLVAFSPIFGTHKGKEYMKAEIRRWTKFVAGIDDESSEVAKRHFDKVGLKTKILRKPVNAELMKIMSTTYYGWMIVFFQEFHRIARAYDADFEEIVECIGKIHERTLIRPIFYPDVIGGHCVMQNLRLLLSSHDSEFLRVIEKSNELRKREVQGGNIRQEIERIKKMVDKFWRVLRNEKKT